MENQRPFSVQERKTSKGKKVFYVQFRGPSGEYETAVSSRKSSRAAAENWAALQLEERKKPAARPDSAWPEEITFGEWAELFYGPDCPHMLRRAAEGQTFTDNTTRNNRSIIARYFLADPIAHQRLDAITRPDVLAFRDRLVKSKPAPRAPRADGKKTGGKLRAAGISRTTQRAFEIFRTIIREAHLRGMIAADPLVLVGKIKYEAHERGSLEPAEFRRLVSDPEVFGEDHLARALVVTVALTGLRRSEALALQWQDVDLVAAVIRVCRAWKDSALTIEGPPKWNKLRTIPLAPAAVLILADHRKRSPGPLVFAWPDGQRLGEQFWKKSFRRAMEALEIEDSRAITPHSLRHSLNSLLLAAGSPAEAVRAVLGWSNPKIQENYTHFRGELLRAQGAAIELLAAPEEGGAE